MFQTVFSVHHQELKTAHIDQYFYLLLALAVNHQELKTARTESGICQTSTATCC